MEHFTAYLSRQSRKVKEGEGFPSPSGLQTLWSRADLFVQFPVLHRDLVTDLEFR